MPLEPVNKDEYLSEAQRQGMFAKVAPKSFIVEIIINDKPFKSVASAMNLESMMALLSITTSANLGKVSGYTVYSSNGEPLASVPAVEFMSKIEPLNKKETGKVDATPKGWAAVPVTQTATPNFQALIDDAREQERKAAPGQPKPQEAIKEAPAPPGPSSEGSS